MIRICTVFFALCLPFQTMAAPLYPNSVVSNDLEFIKTSDKGVFHCLRYEGTARQEMADKRHDRLLADGVYTYTANFKDGTSVGIWVHPDVGSQGAALKLAKQASGPLGKLPTIMRRKLNHVVIHSGDETAFVEDQGRFFAMYSKNMAKRISTHDLEETVFHESVHATLDVPYAKSRDWKRAQKADKGFVTKYGQQNKSKEDMAESALFAWAVLQHPGRLGASVEKYVNGAMPNRLAFFKKIFIDSGPVFQKVGPVKGC
jgi:hypothetical protein